MSSLVINVPAGRFYVSNIMLAHGITLRGQAIQSTMFNPVPGTTGSWFMNPRTGPPNGHGNAGKISIERMRLDGCCPGTNPNPDGSMGLKSISAGIDLGGGDGGWGDYSDLRDIEVSNLPNATAVKLQVNVSVLYNVWTESTRNGIINADEGPGASCLMAFGCGVMAFTGTGIKLQNADCWVGVEIEAPLDGSTPVEMYGSSSIDGILIGPPNSGKAHFETFIKVDASPASAWGLPAQPGGWHGGNRGGNDPAVRASRGWSVNGLVIDNSSTRADNTWNNVITVNGKGVEASWSSACTLLLARWVSPFCLAQSSTKPLHFFTFVVDCRRHVVTVGRAILELRRCLGRQGYATLQRPVHRSNVAQAVLCRLQGRHTPVVRVVLRTRVLDLCSHKSQAKFSTWLCLFYLLCQLKINLELELQSQRSHPVHCRRKNAPKLGSSSGTEVVVVPA
eukprot:SAG11_NODE_697_length_7684_cov_8.250231_4_plen_450_part_00